MMRLIHKLSFRKCRKGCNDPNFHTAHLTAFGRWRYAPGRVIQVPGKGWHTTWRK